MNELLRRLLALPPQASTFAREIDLLHYSVIIVTMLGATAVAAAAAYFVVKYRRRTPLARMHAQDPSSNREPAGLPLRLELAVVVGLLALFVAWWVVGFRQFVMLQVPPAESLVIYASAKQWMWTFIYPSGGTSNGVLYIPAGKPIKMVLSSRDVIHSFYVPEFRIKKDVLPGQVTTVWFQAQAPGTASLYCSEYCGTEHSLMLAEVTVLSPAAYAEQLERLQPLRLPGPAEAAVGGQRGSALVSLAQMGERVAARHGCLRCHTLDGTPHLGPTWLGLLGSTVPLRDGGAVQADEGYITESMMDPRVKLRAGFEPIMPSYQGQLDAPETGALIELIRSLRAPALGATSPLAPSDAPALRLPTAPAESDVNPPPTSTRP